MTKDQFEKPLDPEFPLHDDSLTVQGAPARHNEYGAIMAPIFLSTTYRLEDINQAGPYEYIRTQNPTRQKAEDAVARLDHADHALGFASGMAAIATVFEHFHPGDHILSSANIYGGTYRFFLDILGPRKVDYDFITDLSTLSDADFKPNTKAVFLETPANPTLRVYDIAKIAELAHRHGALLIVDNTFMTGYLQKPLALGADVTVYSATKFYGGHADLNAGFITLNDTDLYNEFFFYQNTLGATLSPFDSYTLLRGIRTLAIRLDRQQENVKAVISALEKHPAVSQVLYPGWYSPDEAAIQKKQAGGLGAVISFAVKPGVDLGVFFEKMQMIDLAVSLGGVESLVCRPTTMTHAPYPKDKLKEIGVRDNLVRFAVGIENKDDIIYDLSQALTIAQESDEVLDKKVDIQ